MMELLGEMPPRPRQMRYPMDEEARNRYRNGIIMVWDSVPLQLEDDWGLGHSPPLSPHAEEVDSSSSASSQTLFRSTRSMAFATELAGDSDDEWD